MADREDLDYEKKSQKELIELLKEKNKLEKISNESVQETIDRLNNEKIVLEQIAEARSDLFDAQERTNLSIKHRLESAKALLKLDLEGVEIGSQLYRNKMREYDLKVKSLQLEEKSVEKARELVGLVVSNQWKNSTWGLLQSPEGWKGMSDGIKDTLTPMNMFGSAVMKMQEQTMLLAYAQDAAIAEMNKMTSAAPGLEDQLINLEHEFQSYGVSADEAGQSIGTLFKEVNDFSRMGPETQKELAETTAVLNELGVEMGTTAKVAQTMTKVFGQSGKEAAATSRELFSFAQSIGMNADEVAANFAAAGPEMAAFGAQGVDTFKKLQAASKQSGLEVGRMLSIVEKFDQFDSAAESVGQLNAILGGPFLSSLDMVTTTDPTERMKMLSDAVNQSGQSFDEMSYYQRKALTEAMGLQDVSELALVMRDGFDAAVPAQQQSAEELANQAKQAAEFQTIQDEMNQTFRAFAVSMRPVVEIFKGFLNLIQWFNKALGPVGIGGITLMAAAFFSLYKIMGMVNILQQTLGFNIFKGIAAKIKDIFFTKAQTVANNDLADSQNKQAKATGKSGKAAGSAVPMLLALGAAVLMIGGGVFLAAAGVALLVLAFSQLNTAQLIAATIALVAFGLGVVTVIGILALLVAGPQAALVAGAVSVLIAVGFAVLLIGAAVGIAAAGLALFVASFALLFSVADPTTMLAFTASFAGFVAVLYSMIPLAFFFPLLVLVLAAVSSALVGIALAMSLMNFSNFEPIGEFFRALSLVVTDTEGGILRVAEAMAIMTEEINKLDADKAVKYTAVMTSTAVAANSPAFAGGGHGGTTTTAASSGQPIEIVLKLKEKVLGKTVGKIVDGKFKMENA